MSNIIQEVRDKTGNTVFPITHERAVWDSSGATLETKLQDLQSTGVQLDGKISQLGQEVSDLEEGLVFADTIRKNPSDVSTQDNMGINSSPYEIEAQNGYKLYYLPMKAGQKAVIHFTLASGYVVSGTTVNVPTVGASVSDYLSRGKTYTERELTAASACYLVIRVGSTFTDFYVTLSNEGFGGDVKAAMDEQYAKTLHNDAQVLSVSEKAQAKINIAVRDDIYGKRRNYDRKTRLSSGNTLYYEGYNVTDFIPVENGDEIVWNFGGTGISICRLELFDADKTYIDGWGSNGYTATRTVTISNANWKYIRACFSDGINAPVIINDVPYYLQNDVDGYTDFVKSGLLDALRWKPLPLGKLINCDTDASGHLKHDASYDALRVTTASNITPPFPGATIRVRIPDNLSYILQMYLWVGTANGSHTVFSTLFFDQTEATIPETALCIRPVFRARTTKGSDWSAPISATDIEAMLTNGSLAIEYYDDSADGIVERNVANMANLAAIRRKLLSSPLADNSMDSMPVFAHITDLHGDAPRWKNFLDFCDAVGVDFALETGDANLVQIRDATQYIYDFANVHYTDVLAAIGNHESFPTGSSSLFADNMAELVAKYNYLSASETPTTSCYYYKDYASKKIRVIVLNQHEDGVYARRLGQTQISWLISTLAATPAGYGVVIAYHAPEDKVDADAPYDVFRQPAPNTGASYEPNGAYVDKRAISLIVDAFIAKSTASFTYNDHSATYDGSSDTTTQEVTVSADFSNVDESTEFICYVCGHRHEDWIGYYHNAVQKQLCLCITCGNALYADSTNPYWSNQSDLPRGGKGVSQDAFCVYAIDRTGGNVKVMRVGATVTEKMVKREMMVIPYKD